jgi:Xaa-Pro aminopeptidase
MHAKGSDDSDGLPVLIFGDQRQLSLRHELPLVLSFPVLYLELADRCVVVADAIDKPRVATFPQIDEVISFQELGFEELLGAGSTRIEALAELVVRACRSFDISEAVAPPELDAFTAAALRAGQVQLVLDEHLFNRRRRHRTAAELEGIERAQRAAQNAVAAVREALRDGGSHSSESLHKIVGTVLAEGGASPEKGAIVSSGPDSADPLEFGSGPIAENAPIVVDIYPRDLQSGCFGDLSRTLCVGAAPEELVNWHRDLRQTQLLVFEAIRPGVTGEELNRIGCEYLSGLGYKTRLDIPPNTVLEEGVLHLLGHGVGLDLIEAPTLEEGGEELIAGDVITVEPALYRPGFGGCRIEDLVLVTEDGYRNLTDCPYEYEL